jgi:hypothetical protein
MRFGQDYEHAFFLDRRERVHEAQQIIGCRMIDEEKPLSVFGSQFTSGELAYPNKRVGAEPSLLALDFE